MYYLFLIATILFSAQFVPVSADTGSQYGQYGGTTTPSASISVNKVVGRDAEKFVENYSPSDARFKANERVYFQIKVKNTSSIDLPNVQMVDTLPDYIDAVEGPGEYNPTNRTITWTYPTLKSGEERTEKLIVQIKPQDQLPSDKGTFCVNNKVSGRSNGTSDEDTAQFCIEKLVAMTKSGTPTQSPKAGAEFGLIFGALNIAGLGAGIYLKKKA